MNTDFVTKPASSLLSRVTANKHTSSMALIVGGGELARGLTRIWCPHYQQQVDETVKEIQHVAIMYGLLMAGDSKPSPDTSTQTNKPTS